MPPYWSRPSAASYSGVSSNGPRGSREGPHIKQWLSALGGLLISAGVLSVLYLSHRPNNPRTLTIEADDPLDIEYSPTEYEDDYEECEEYEDECPLKILPQKRRWPTLEQEEKEKRLREEKKQRQLEEKRKRIMEDNIARTMAAIAALMKEKS